MQIRSNDNTSDRPVKNIPIRGFLREQWGKLSTPIWIHCASPGPGWLSRKFRTNWLLDGAGDQMDVPRAIGDSGGDV